MKRKRILSGILILLGLGLYIFGSYISGEVTQGRKKIASAQKGVDQARELSEFSPFSKDIGDMVTGSAQKKIDAGRQDANKYQVLANWLHGSGIFIFITGIGLLAYSFVHKKNS